MREQFLPEQYPLSQKTGLTKTSKTKEGLVNVEEKEAGERFADLIEMVNRRYEGPESTLAASPEQLKSFKEHNAEILELCVERGLEKGLNEKELKTLEMAAILHDLTKGDKPPEEMEDVPNYTLVTHGEAGAREVKKIITEHPEILPKILGADYEQKEVDEVITAIENAIRTHMGPHPGFMNEMLRGANRKLKEKGMAEIKHPYPEQGDKAAETLLAADMRSLAGRKGREKVLVIRSAVPFFKEQDEKTCEEHKKYGVDLALGEAALLSGFDSAEQARDMLKNADDRKWVNEAVESSKKGGYLYEGEKINYADAAAKRDKYQAAKKKEELEKAA